MTPQQRHWYAQLYNGQEIIFGVVLYVFGLTLVTRGGTGIYTGVEYIFGITPLLLIGVGVLASAWGVLTVVQRNQRNPFSRQT